MKFNIETLNIREKLKKIRENGVLYYFLNNTLQSRTPPRDHEGQSLIGQIIGLRIYGQSFAFAKADELSLRVHDNLIVFVKRDFIALWDRGYHLAIAMKGDFLLNIREEGSMLPISSMHQLILYDFEFSERSLGTCSIPNKSKPYMIQG